MVRYQSINTVNGVLGGPGIGQVGNGPFDPLHMPEPFSWMMLIVGFWLVDDTMRRRTHIGLSAAA